MKPTYTASYKKPLVAFVGMALPLCVVFLLHLIQSLAGLFRISLPLLFCMCYALTEGGPWALVLAALSGLFTDVFLTAYPGANALLYLYMALGCVLLKERFFRPSFQVAVLCTSLASVTTFLTTGAGILRDFVAIPLFCLLLTPIFLLPASFCRRERPW